MNKLRCELLNLQKISDGIFFPQILYKDQRDRFKLNRLKQLHPDWIKTFDEDWHRFHNFKRKILILNSDNSRTTFTKKDVLQRVIWSSFCYEHGLKMKVPESFFSFDRNQYLLDTFSLKVPNNDQATHLITIPGRQKNFNDIPFIRPVIPKILEKYYFQNILNQLLEEAEEGLEFDVWPQRFDEGFYKPGPNIELHKNKILYPGLSFLMSGEEKKDQDLHYLRSNKVPPSGYKFGVKLAP